MTVREKLVELLFNCAPKNIKTEHRGDKIAVTISQGNLADYLIAHGVTVQRWIPVTERLPGFECERVLVMIRGYFILGYPKMDTDRYVDQRWVRYGDNVTHWMPLPEPPKEG